MAVPQQQRPVAHRVTDEFVPVEIPFARALGPRHRDRKRRGEPDVVRDTSGKQPPRPGVERRRPRVLQRPAGDRTIGVVLCATLSRVARPLVPHMAQSSSAPPPTASPRSAPAVDKHYKSDIILIVDRMGGTAVKEASR